MFEFVSWPWLGPPLKFLFWRIFSIAECCSRCIECFAIHLRHLRESPRNVWVSDRERYLILQGQRWSRMSVCLPIKYLSACAFVSQWSSIHKKAQDGIRPKWLNSSLNTRSCLIEFPFKMYKHPEQASILFFVNKCGNIWNTLSVSRRDTGVNNKSIMALSICGEYYFV